MKIHKWSIIISLFAFVLGIILSLFITTIFMQNVFIGIISSSLLSCCISIMSYMTEKRRLLYLIYKNVYTFLDLLGVESLRRDCSVDVKEYRQELRSVKRWYEENIYLNITELSFLCKRERTRKIFNELSVNLSMFYNLICEDVSVLDKFMLGDISKEQVTNHTYCSTKKETVDLAKTTIKILDELRKVMNFYGKDN